MNSKANPTNSPAKYLTLHFEGYFMCRLATDPDPTNETRGLSGYTMALASEKNLDQVIRLQVDENYLKQNLRPPAKEMGLEKKLKEGVQVRSVTFDGKPWNDLNEVGSLIGARVFLRGRDYPFDGPTFESRNNITGSDDTMAFVVDPFKLEIKKEGKWSIKAEDNLNPADHDQKIWQILNPAIYGRRLTSAFEENSQEVAEAINVFDYYGYFYDRHRFLQSQIQQLEKENLELEAEKTKIEENKIKIEQFKSRLYQLEYWGDRIINKLGFKTSWNFEINGDKKVINGKEINKDQNAVQSLPDIGGKIYTNQPWPVQFWFGGWDGDLLVGYMRGSLSMPFEPD